MPESDITILLVDDEEMVLTSIRSFLAIETDYRVHTFTSPLPEIAAFGRFDDIAGADVIVWHALALNIISSGTGPEVRFSRQEMR